MTNLKQYSEEVFEPEGHSPQGLVQILTRRAIFIHKVISKNQGRNYKLLREDEKTIPEYAVLKQKSSGGSAQKKAEEEPKKEESKKQQ